MNLKLVFINMLFLVKILKKIQLNNCLITIFLIFLFFIQLNKILVSLLIRFFIR
jgi:hypothetical protein